MKITKPLSRSYVIEGNPIPLARHRHTGTRAWDSQKQAKFGLGVQITNQHEQAGYFNGPVRLDVIFYMPIPKKSPNYIQGRYHLIKPDLSNLIKMLEDVATKITYHDDCIISVIFAQKRYSLVPRTEFTITELRVDDDQSNK